MIITLEMKFYLRKTHLQNRLYVMYLEILNVIII